MMDLKKDFYQKLFLFFNNCSKPICITNQCITTSSSIKELSYSDFSFNVSSTNRQDNNHDQQQSSKDPEDFHNNTEKEAIDYLIQTSKEWKLHVSKIISIKNRWHLSLNRQFTYQTLLNILHNDNTSYGKLNKPLTNCIINVKSIENDNTISTYRCKLIESVIENLLKYTSCKMATDTYDLTIFVTYKSTCHEFDNLQGMKKRIFCGIVKDSIQKKISNLSANDYIRFSLFYIQISVY